MSSSDLKIDVELQEDDESSMDQEVDSSLDQELERIKRFEETTPRISDASSDPYDLKKPSLSGLFPIREDQEQSARPETRISVLPRSVDFTSDLLEKALELGEWSNSPPAVVLQNPTANVSSLVSCFNCLGQLARFRRILWAVHTQLEGLKDMDESVLFKMCSCFEYIYSGKPVGKQLEELFLSMNRVLRYKIGKRIDSVFGYINILLKTLPEIMDHEISFLKQNPIRLFVDLFDAKLSKCTIPFPSSYGKTKIEKQAISETFLSLPLDETLSNEHGIVDLFSLLSEFALEIFPGFSPASPENSRNNHGLESIALKIMKRRKSPDPVTVYQFREYPQVLILYLETSIIRSNVYVSVPTNLGDMGNKEYVLSSVMRQTSFQGGNLSTVHYSEEKCYEVSSSGDIRHLEVRSDMDDILIEHPILCIYEDFFHSSDTTTGGPVPDSPQNNHSDSISSNQMISWKHSDVEENPQTGCFYNLSSILLMNK